MQQRLYRSRKEKIIGGVCGGMGAYFDIDPVLVRLAFVILALLHGIGILVYIICWIVVPAERSLYSAIAAGEDPTAAAEAIAAEAIAAEGIGDPAGLPGGERKGSRNRVAGMILVALGVLFLINSLVPAFCIGDYWPIILIALGAGLFASSVKRSA